MRRVDSQRISGFLPLSLFLSLDVLHLSFLLLSPSLPFLRAERRQERKGRGSSQSERAERRYLKHMQRVQLRSGSPSPLDRERGKKSRTMAACVRLPGIRLTTIYATSATTTVHLHLFFTSPLTPSFAYVSFPPRLSRPDLFVRLVSSRPGTREARILSTRMPGPEKHTEYSIQEPPKIDSKFNALLIVSFRLRNNELCLKGGDKL